MREYDYIQVHEVPGRFKPIKSQYEQTHTYAQSNNSDYQYLQQNLLK